MSEDKYIHRNIIKNVAFFGDAGATKESEVYKDAYEVAEILAKEGFTIVNGGGPGVMEASSKGAEAVKGETIAVTFYPKDAPGFEGRYLGNTVDKEIKTANYIERMFKLMEHADIYVIFKGGSGTVSEFGTAWVLAKIYYCHHKPFILFGGFWRDIIKCLKTHLSLDKEELDVFEIVSTKEEVLPAIKRFEEKMQKLDHSHCRVCGEKAFMI